MNHHHHHQEAGTVRAKAASPSCDGAGKDGGRIAAFGSLRLHGELTLA